MHKDIFLFKKEHEDKASKILDLFLENSVASGYEGVICIYGISGTGKSEVAWWVARKLYKMGISSHVVNLDRYYRVKDDKRDQWRKDNKYIGHEEMDYERIRQELKDFSNNEVRVLIFEGIYAGHIDGMRFFLEGNVESTDEFRRVRGKENEEDEWRKIVVSEEYADVLVQQWDYKI